MLLVSPVWGGVEAEPLLALRSSPAPASRPLLAGRETVAWLRVGPVAVQRHAHE